jgi:hypothetical protein
VLPGSFLRWFGTTGHQKVLRARQARVTVAELIRAQLRLRDTIPRSRSNSND